MQPLFGADLYPEMAILVAMFLWALNRVTIDVFEICNGGGIQESSAYVLSAREGLVGCPGAWYDPAILNPPVSCCDVG